MKQLWIVALSLCLVSLAPSVVSAQHKLAPQAKTQLKAKQAPPLKVSSTSGRHLKANLSRYKASNAPQAKQRTGEVLKQLDASSPKTKTNGLIGEDGLRASLIKRRAGAQEILKEATQLKKDALAAKRDAKTLSAIDGLVRDAQATIKATNGLIGEDGKRAFGKGDYARLGAADGQAQRLQSSLESVLGLVEPWISR